MVFEQNLRKKAEVKLDDGDNWYLIFDDIVLS
jgi:hypothetical protein